MRDRLRPAGAKSWAFHIAPGVLVALLVPTGSAAEERPSVEIAFTEEPPEIDGVLDETPWTRAPTLGPLTQVEPIEGAEPSERTVTRLLYDENFLYVGFRCLDRTPDLINATTMSRDASLGADDHVAFIVDPFFDRRNAYFFEMNAVGAKGDALIEDSRGIH